MVLDWITGCQPDGVPRPITVETVSYFSDSLIFYNNDNNKKHSGFKLHDMAIDFYLLHTNLMANGYRVSA